MGLFLKECSTHVAMVVFFSFFSKTPLPLSVALLWNYVSFTVEVTQENFFLLTAFKNTVRSDYDTNIDKVII